MVTSVFLTTLVGGGVQRVMINIANGLANRGLAVDLVVAKGCGHFKDLVDGSVKIWDFRLTLSKNEALAWASLPSLTTYLKNRHPQILLASPGFAGIVALISKEIAHTNTKVVPLVDTTMSIANKRKLVLRPLTFLASRWYKRAFAIVASYPQAADDLAQNLGVDPGRIVVIHNPVVTKYTRGFASERVGIPERFLDEGFVLGVGSLTRVKGFDLLVEALAIARKNGATFNLIILGEGPERPVLERLVSERGLAGHVLLPGFVTNPYAYMSKARVFVLSSRWEGLPGVLIEALLMGTPVVASDCASGGPRYILDDGRLGILVPPEDPHALACGIIEALKDSGLRWKRMERALLFSQEKCTELYVRLISDLVALDNPSVAGVGM